ncbi:MAG: hypothetical protein NZM37_01070 [Sandaracinaceae bacterium]|nr:hypothetical protein [Sandaracinaceae bacterium]
MSERWLALDLLRFSAIVLMVQGHVFRALLSSAYDGMRWLRHHDFVHGYTAPIFLFASGLAFGHTTFRSWFSHLKWGPALRKRWGRYGWLLAIGYALHIPARGLSKLLALDKESVLAWLQVDVLQHIAVSLGLLQLLVFVLRTPKRFAWVVGVLFGITLFGAPWVWRWEPSKILPLPLAAYLNAKTGSPFPLVPWAAFTHGGVLVAYMSRHFKEPSKHLAWPLLYGALALFVMPIAINRTGFQPFGAHDFWKTDPYYSLFRLANVIFLLSAWCFVENWIRYSINFAEKNLNVHRFLDFLLHVVRRGSEESLVIYVGHLVVLHGCVLFHGISQYWGRSFSFFEAMGIFLLLLTFSIGLGFIWHFAKRLGWPFRAFQWITVTAFAYLVLVEAR